MPSESWRACRLDTDTTGAGIFDKVVLNKHASLRAERRYCISQNPHIEAKIVEELDSLGLLATESRPKPRELTYGDLSKLTYINLVIKACHPLLPRLVLANLHMSWNEPESSAQVQRGAG